jgi:hypothetical protein
MKEIKETAEKEGLTFSDQAISMLMQLKNPEQKAKELIELAKKRKWVIAGGDVLKYIVMKELPTSLKNSDDFVEVKQNG